MGIRLTTLHLAECKYEDLLEFIVPTQRICWEISQKLLAKSCSNTKKRSLALACRAQRGQCLVANGSLIDGHKETIGLAESQWESAWSSVGRVEH